MAVIEPGWGSTTPYFCNYREPGEAREAKATGETKELGEAGGLPPRRCAAGGMGPGYLPPADSRSRAAESESEVEKEET